MLPATLQFLIAMIAYAINERMQRKLDYTQEEVRGLKEILETLTGSGRISFTADQRRRHPRYEILAADRPELQLQAALRARSDSLRASAEKTAPGLDPAARSAFI
jgi:hypothetical protein